MPIVVKTAHPSVRFNNVSLFEILAWTKKKALINSRCVDAHRPHRCRSNSLIIRTIINNSFIRQEGEYSLYNCDKFSTRFALSAASLIKHVLHAVPFF